MCMGESQGVLTRCVWVRVREFLPGVYGESRGVLTRCVWVRVGEFLPGVYG